VILRHARDRNSFFIEFQREGGEVVKRMRLGCIVALGVSMQACGTFYVHSDADQKAMDGAVTGAEAARTAQLASLAAHREVMQRLVGEERAAVTAENIRLRDGILTIAINGSDSAALDRSVSREVSLLIGAGQFPDVNRNGQGLGGAASFAHFAADLATMRRQLAADARTVRLFESTATAKGVRILSPCNSKGAGLVVEAGTDKEAVAAAATLGLLCDDLAGSSAELERPYAAAAASSALVACLLGQRDSCGTADRPQSGLLYEATADALDIDKLVALNASLAKAAQAELAALEKTYACAVQAEASGNPGATVQQAATLVDAFVRSLPTTPAAVEAEAAKPPAPAAKAEAEPKDCPGGRTATASFQSLLAKLEKRPEDLRKLLEGLSSFAPAESVVAALADARAEYQESKLAGLLAAASKPTETTDAARAGTAGVGVDQVAVAGFVALLDPLQRLVAARSGEFPDTRAILVDLALARFNRARAGIELDRLKRSRDVLLLKADAYLNQAASLARASSAPRNEAIVALADAWNRGAIPAAAANVELRGFQYGAWIAQEEAAVEVTYGTVGPLLAELQTYAAGGFTAEEIARALSAAGLVGIAVGAN
jgi:hypothetical protein